MSTGYMRKSFKDSLKVLEADIQHANTLASDFPMEHDGACLQMRMSYGPAAHLFLFLVQWTDIHLAGALGLFMWMELPRCLRMKRKRASESSMQLQNGVTDTEDKRQKAACMDRYRRREDEECRQLADVDFEREEECGICMETDSKILLPNCNHTMCLKCYREWRSRSQSCPFCRDNLKRVNSGDLWVYTDSRDIIDMTTVTRENLRRLFMYIDKLPLIVPYTIFDTYDSHLR
ncbi:hypothetical protein F3Y22_tig00111792pilonHSYRG00067 [Hibiscus syriacus]|uniref:RING-type domain-containing protein n=1 Tax=Hibiscus syriacus TaxID=106335 RepID=A0A6A2YF60_HIBSY|nr:hypothetical protein F3Y22_tig00111792pilonHSYRG00067 [Hibiscus syriacus]